MCDCAEDRIKLITEKYPQWEGKDVESYEFENVNYNLLTSKMHYCFGIKIKTKGMKKVKRTELELTYCPFCGVKYEDSGK